MSLIYNNRIEEVLKFSIQQIFAESYFELYWEEKQKALNNNSLNSPTTIIQLKALGRNALMKGNSHKDPYIDQNGERIYQGGFAKLPETLAAEAMDKYEIVDYRTNQTAGFSAIVLKDKQSGEYTIAFRSTEYVEDFARDAEGADGEIKANGFAYGQLSEMEKYYTYLKSGTNPIIPTGTQLNVSGYSLGGHLAYSFYVLHSEDIKHVYTENAAGIGTIGTVGNDAKTLTNYKAQLSSAVQRFTNIKDNFLISMFGSITTNLNSSNLDTILNSISKDTSANIRTSLSSSNPNYNLAFSIANTMNSLLSSFSYAPDYDMVDLKLAIRNQVLNKPLLNGTEDDNSIYKDLIYKIALTTTKKEYNSASLPVFGSLWSKAQGEDGEIADAIFAPEKFTVMSGLGSESILSANSDFTFVSKSNLHPEFTDIFVEDQNETIKALGRLPMLSFTKDWEGDFGNTHSITLIIDSLRAISTLHKIDPYISVSSGGDILNSASNQHANFHSGIWNDLTVESNSVSNVIDYLYRLFIVPQAGNPSREDTNFTRRYNYLGNIDKRDSLHIKENKIIEAVGTNNYQIVSLYNSLRSNQFLNSQEILTKAKQNNSEGMAYRYALKEMSNFVVLGFDYSRFNQNGELDLNKHSDLWYKARAEILVSNIKHNVDNDEIYSGLETKHGIITDKASFRNLSYEIRNSIGQNAWELSKSMPAYLVSKYLGGYLVSQDIKKIIRDIRLDNKTEFSNDSIQPYYLTNSQIINSQNYNDTKYNDFIFMGNKVNTLLVFGGDDTIETGNQNNFINANQVDSKSSLNLALFGNNTINLSNNYYGGQIQYKNKLLTGGSIQLDGKYVDYNYSNITYEIYYQGSKKLKINYLNEDNTYNTTIISNYNNSLFGLIFNNTPSQLNNRPAIDLSYIPQNNPYTINAVFISKDPSEQYIAVPSPDLLKVVDESNGYLYLYYENGTTRFGNKIDFDQAVIDQLNPKSISVADLHIAYFRNQDKVIINKNMHYEGNSISRLGDDLIIINNNSLLSSPKQIKNYFKFDHTNHTNIWFADISGNATTELTQSHLLNYDTLTGTNNADVINAGSFSTVFDSNGWDTYTGGTQNTTFIDVPKAYLGSNDTYNSGNGNNKFVFSLEKGAGTDNINNIKITDKIVLYKPGSNVPNFTSNYYTTTPFSQLLEDLQIELAKDGNNLIIREKSYTGKNFNLTINNYYNVFTNPATNSGIYFEDIYGNSYPFDISNFITGEIENKSVATNSTEAINISATNRIKNINLNGASVDVKIEGLGKTINTGTGGAPIITLDRPTQPTSLSNGTRIVAQTVHALPNEEITRIYVEGFNPNFDTLSFEGTTTANTVMTEEGNDLFVRILTNNQVSSLAVVKDYFLNIGSNARTGIEVYTNTRTPTISFAALGGMLSEYNLTSAQTNANLNASNINKNTIITSTGNGATITGGQFNDEITAGSSDDKFIMSTGIDIYHFTASSGIDELVFNKDKVLDGSLLVIKFDASVTKSNISLYYDKYDEVFTIKVNHNAGLIISNMDAAAAYNIEQFMQIKLSDQSDLLASSYEVTSGAPFTYEGLPNRIQIGTSTNNILDPLMATNEIKNYLVFGADGNDEITGNFNETLNNDYKASLLIGGKGTDSIYAGSYDVVMARQGDGADTIHYDNNHEDFILNFLKPKAGDNAFGVKTVGNNLEVYYANNTTDKVILANYWNLTKDNLNIALTDMEANNATHLRAYSLNEIMQEMGYTKSNTQSSVNYVDYSEIVDIMGLESSDKLIGGELANYYAQLGNLTGFSVGSAVDIMNKFDSQLLMDKTGTNDPSDFRKI